MSPERRHLWLGLGLLGAGTAFYLAVPTEDETVVAVAAPVATTIAPATPPPAPAQAAAPVPDLSQLRLHGLTASGAIIASSTGQRLVRLGREVMPGVILSEVRQHHALLTTAAGRFELGFLGLADAAAAPLPATAPTERTIMASAPARRTEVLQYRFGLAPRRADGRVTGFAVRSGAEMPLLQRAGLRAGDVLVGVNGQTFDSDEKVMELATEIAGSYTAEFEFERNGRRMKALLPVNPRS